jgi:hypothetical protein
MCYHGQGRAAVPATPKYLPTTLRRRLQRRVGRPVSISNIHVLAKIVSIQGQQADVDENLAPASVANAGKTPDSAFLDLARFS